MLREQAYINGLWCDADDGRTFAVANPATGPLVSNYCGQRIFSDRRFSGNNAVSCASCHLPDQQFQDGRPVGVGVGTSSGRA